MASDRELEVRLPPSDQAAERALLGSLLRENDLVAEVVRSVRVDDFYSHAHQSVFVAIVGLFEKGKPIDGVTLANALQASGKLDDVGGHGFIIELWESAPAAANVPYYGEIIREMARRRRLIHTCHEMGRRAFDGAEPIDDLLSEAERRVFAIGRDHAAQKAVTLGEIASQAVDRIRERAKAGRIVTGIPTGWHELDGLTSGFQPGELVIIGARPSVGKTAFLVGCVCHLAYVKIPSLTFSIEQGRLEIGERLVCSIGSVDSQRTRGGDITQADVENLAGARQDCVTAPGLLIDQTDISPLDVLANTRRYVATHQIRVVFVDYLQLIRSEDRRVPRHEQVAMTTRRMKLMARELGIPVVVLAQLNRDSEQGNRKPRLSDLKESGAIEQDADCVLFIHRPEDGSAVREIIVAKQRNGPIGKVELTFKGEYMRFESKAPPTPDEWRTEGRP